MARQTRREARHEARQARRRRFSRRLVFVLVAIFSLLFFRWIIAPGSTAAEDVEPADAVVLFVGGRGERLLKAAELINAGAAEVLVIPNGTIPGWSDANRFCLDETPGIRVICPTPYPDDTRGEARVIGELARVEGWDELIMVTSDFHVSRARLKLRRCFDGVITAVAAEPEVTFWTSVGRNLREMGGHFEARALERGC